jgi:arylsulfatase A-like enzyme
LPTVSFVFISQGDKRQYYAMALSALDKAVKYIHDALYDVGMLENTYIIFASDNGGCFKGGGADYPLRGTKFTMLEGGTKVNAFIYSYMISSDLRGTESDALMHVSDWFPTILELADITYEAEDDYSIDGVSQVSAWTDSTSTRTTMLYNSYTNAASYDLDSMWENGPFAVRNEQYKLIHFYNGTYADWHYYDATANDDDAFSVYSSNCVANEALDGEYVVRTHTQLHRELFFVLNMTVLRLEV